MSIEQLRKIISPKFTEQVLLDCVVKKSGLSDVQIKGIKMGQGSKKGDSYLSNITRFTVDAVGKNRKNETESVVVPMIVKFLPTNLGHRKTFRSTDFFENEAIFYEKVWPTLDKFQKSKNLQEYFDNIPLMLAAHVDGVNDFVAMEDLSYDGYGTSGRGSGLNYDNTVIILKMFAEFNGLAFACKDQQPEVFEDAATSLKETYFAEKFRKWYEGFQRNVLFVVYKDAVKKELPPVYLEKFNKILETDIFAKASELCQVRGPLSAITHGDAWMPNFLIKYSNENRPEKVKMIDFQLTRYTTISNDLLFLLLSCVDKTVLEQHWDDFLAEYIKALSQTLKKLGSDPNLITLEQLKADIKDSIIFGITMCMEANVMCQLDDDEVADLDGIEGDTGKPLETIWAIKPFKSQEKRKTIAALIKFTVDKNLL